MKIAVTGSSGFIGRHVLRALSRRDDVEVVASSRGKAGDWLPAGVHHVPLDISKPSTDQFVQLGRPDVLIHLAWTGLPNYFEPHHFETQLAEQYRFLGGMVKAGLPSLLCAGTCFEYGMRSGELVESMRTDPGNPYGFAKDALRRQLEFLALRNAFKLTWARLFYTWGEGQAASSLYSQFRIALARGDATFLMSGGEQLRDYLPVTALAQRLVCLACDAPGAGIVNVCSGEPVAVKDLVGNWLADERSAMTLTLGHYPYPSYEPMAFWGNNDRLTQLLRGH